jgi:type III secretion protein J
MRSRASGFNVVRVMAALLACLLMVGCTRTPLYTQLDEQQANEMMAALLDAGIPAQKDPSPSKTSWEVTVNRGDIPYAMQVLHSRGLPRTQYRSLGDVFKKEGFASSAMEEKARYIFGRSQELSHTLARIDGVVEARVHLAVPDRDPLGGSVQESSASVLIFERPGRSLRDRETDIKVFVKDSLEGLSDINKVTVKFFTVAAPPKAYQSGGPLAAVMGSIDLTVVIIGAVVLVLLGVAFFFFGRIRARFAPAPAAPAGNARSGVWNG